MNFIYRILLSILALTTTTSFAGGLPFDNQHKETFANDLASCRQDHLGIKAFVKIQTTSEAIKLAQEADKSQYDLCNLHRLRYSISIKKNTVGNSSYDRYCGKISELYLRKNVLAQDSKNSIAQTTTQILEKKINLCEQFQAQDPKYKQKLEAEISELSREAVDLQVRSYRVLNHQSENQFKLGVVAFAVHDMERAEAAKLAKEKEELQKYFDAVDKRGAMKTSQFDPAKVPLGNEFPSTSGAKAQQQTLMGR